MESIAFWFFSLSWSMFVTYLVGTVFLLTTLSFVVLNPHQKLQRRWTLGNLWQVSPFVRSEWLSGHLGEGRTVHLKLESLQPSGSFKIRGVATFIRKMYTMSKNVDTFVTTSSANAGMAVAYCSRAVGCKCIVVLDETQRDNKLIPSFIAYGAEVQFAGENWNEADEHALAMCSKSTKMQYVPMFSDRSMWHGYSTLMKEMKLQMKGEQPDCIVCACGGGGLLMGVLGGLYQNGWSRRVKVVAAQSRGCALLHESMHNGFTETAVKCMSPQGDDLGHRAVARHVMTMCERFEGFNPIESMVVEDEDVLSAATLFGMKERVLIEPLCAVAVAAVLKNKEFFEEFQSIVVIVCGGNHVHFDVDRLRKTWDDREFQYEDSSVMQKAMPPMPRMVIDDDEEFEGAGVIYDSDTEEI